MEIELTEKRNNFNLLRLLAATLVLISHSYDIRGIREGDPLFQASAGRYSFSSVGLTIFFVISGFLVSMSLDQTKSARIFLLKRFLRIWPGLAINILFTVIATGFFITVLPLSDFFLNSQTIKYLLLNASTIKSTSWLPGAFHNKPVNISLWTIPIEVRLYLILLMSSLLGIFSRKYLMLICWFLGILFCIALVFHFSFVSIIPRPIIWDSSLMMFFLSGSVAYIFRQKIKFNAFICVALLLVYIFLAKVLPSLRYVLEFPFLTYSILFFANGIYVFPLLKIDLSYGIYLYSYPVQAAVQFLFGNSLNLVEFFIIITVVTVLFAIASWYFIEKKALMLKKSLTESVIVN
jgi:peptidoglycan/LPS O-acetylase OafA/YrhL